MAATARFVDAMLRWMHDFPTGSHIATRDRRTSPKNEARILTLLQNGDTERLSALFQHGTDANLIIRAQLKPPHNSSLKLALPLLHIAASNNYLYVAECLLEHGADINGRDKYGTTAVHWAAAAGHLKMLHLLRRRSADLDCADKLGMTPLHIAAHAGRTRALTMLLRNGADCAAQSKHGELALDLARTQKNANCKRALIEALSARAKELELEAEEMEVREVRKVEHDRSGTMLVHSVHSEAESESENESALSELSAHVDSLRAETARMKEMEEERERERLYGVEQERQLERSLLMSQRQKERELKRERSRSTSRSRRTKKKEKEEKGAEEKARRVKNEKKERRRRRRRKEQSVQSGKGQRVSYTEVFKEKAFVRWLECEVALPMYRELFATKGYDRLEAVKGLDGNGLRKMGVKKFKDREVFVREIRKLQQSQEEVGASLGRVSFSRQMSL